MRVALLVVLVACSDDEAGEPPPPDTWPGEVTWTWTFSDAGPCPAGVTTANIYIASYDRDPFTVRNQPRIMRSTSCAAGVSSFPLANPLGIGNRGHDTWVELATADGRIFARSQLENTLAKNATPTAVIEVPRGWAHASWTLFGQTSQRALACDEVPTLTSMLLYEAIEADRVLQPSILACPAGEMWLGLAPGTYDLALAGFTTLAFYVDETPANSKLLGKHALPAQTITADTTLELGAQQITLPDY